MVPNDPIKWAAIIADELIVGGQRVPFERVLARHITSLKNLRLTTGLTWNGIAALLIRAGARRSDGKLISADQIRVAYARLSRTKEGRSRPSEAPQSRPQPVIHQKPVRTPAPPSIPETEAKEDISADELTAALARLTK